VLTFFFVVYFLSDSFGVCAENNDNSTDIRRLLTLKDDEYKNYRNKLVKNGKQYDLEQSLKDSSGKGLAVYIVNCRINYRDDFKVYDSTRVGMTRSGSPSFNISRKGLASLKNREYSWPAFVIEQLWKKLWPEEIGIKKVTQGLFWRDVKGPKILWEKVLTDTKEPLIKAIAVFALCDQNNFAAKAISIIQDPNESLYVKEAVFAYIKKYAPEFGESLICDTIDYWKDNFSLRSTAIYYYSRVLMKKDEKRAKKQLYAWLHDDQLPEDVHTSIVGALMRYATPEDIDIFHNVLKRKQLSGKLKEKIKKVIIRYGDRKKRK
jgi:hypothetical protein